MSSEPEVMRHTGHLIRRAQQRHVTIWQQHVSSEVSSVQFAVLTALDAHPGASQRLLGDELDLDRSTIADIVMRMLRRGLIERQRNPDDLRQNAMWLTAEGRSALQRLRPRVEGIEHIVTLGLSADGRDQLRKLLRAMLSSPLDDMAARQPA
jgi:DNA-binding MarR family transcriptional regulator